MTNQSGGTRPARGNTPSGGQPGKTGPYTAAMWIGGATALLGFYLVLGSYSSHPAQFNFGLALVLIGGAAGLVGAIARTISRNKRQQR